MQEPGRGVLSEVGDLALKLPREPDVVGIEEGDQAAPRAGDALIARMPWPAVRLISVRNTVAEFGDPPPGVVGRSIVDDDDFEIAVSLGKHRLERRRNGPPRVECRHDNRDIRHIRWSLSQPDRHVSKQDAAAPQPWSRISGLRVRHATPGATLGENFAAGTDISFLLGIARTCAATRRSRVISRAALMSART